MGKWIKVAAIYFLQWGMFKLTPSLATNYNHPYSNYLILLFALEQLHMIALIILQRIHAKNNHKK
jgi:hypothetical protein